MYTVEQNRKLGKVKNYAEYESREKEEVRNS